MKFSEYQAKSRKTAMYPKVLGSTFVYPTLGLVGEAGEVAEKVKKIFRDQNGQVSAETKQLLVKELGDVLWYLSQICTELNVRLEDVAQTNLDKLYARLDQGKIAGDGDER